MTIFKMGRPSLPRELAFEILNIYLFELSLSQALVED